MNSPVTVWRHHKKINSNLNKKGRLLVWTKVFVAPAGFEHETPYLVAIVQLDPSASHSTLRDGPSSDSKSSGLKGQRMPLQIVDCEEKDLKVGKQIITIVRKQGKVGLDEVIEYGIKAKLL